MRFTRSATRSKPPATTATRRENRCRCCTVHACPGGACIEIVGAHVDGRAAPAPSASRRARTPWRARARFAPARAARGFRGGSRNTSPRRRPADSAGSSPPAPRHDSGRQFPPGRSCPACPAPAPARRSGAFSPAAGDSPGFRAGELEAGARGTVRASSPPAQGSLTAGSPRQRKSVRVRAVSGLTMLSALTLKTASSPLMPTVKVVLVRHPRRTGAGGGRRCGTTPKARSGDSHAHCRSGRSC